MNEKHNTIIKEMSLLVLGAMLALTGGYISSSIDHRRGIEKIERQYSHDRISMLCAFQSEIQSNLLLMKRDFMDYRKQLSQGTPFRINRPVIITAIFDSHINKIGVIQAPEIISEIVAFYSSLKYFETWCEGTIGLIADVGNSKGYVQSHANTLHAGIYLQKRLEEVTGSYRKKLVVPVFSDEQKKLLDAIKILRSELRATKSDIDLKFHRE